MKRLAFDQGGGKQLQDEDLLLKHIRHLAVNLYCLIKLHATAYMKRNKSHDATINITDMSPVKAPTVQTKDDKATRKPCCTTTAKSAA